MITEIFDCCLGPEILSSRGFSIVRHEKQDVRQSSQRQRSPDKYDRGLELRSLHPGRIDKDSHCFAVSLLDALPRSPKVCGFESHKHSSEGWAWNETVGYMGEIDWESCGVWR